MRKTISILALMLLSMSAMAGNWGLGLKAGVAENNPKDMEDYYDSDYFDSAKLTKNSGVVGVELFKEWELKNETNKLGIKIGAESYGENEFKGKHSYSWYHPGGIGTPGHYVTSSASYKLEETTYSFPITVYHKWDNGIKELSWIVGAGLTIMHSEWKETVSGYGNEKYSKTKLFPHIMAGAEYRFCQLFALGLEARYNIAAKIKKDGDILSDRSGFGGMLTARFYF